MYAVFTFFYHIVSQIHMKNAWAIWGCLCRMLFLPLESHVLHLMDANMSSLWLNYDLEFFHAVHEKKKHGEYVMHLGKSMFFLDYIRF